MWRLRIVPGPDGGRLAAPPGSDSVQPTRVLLLDGDGLPVDEAEVALGEVLELLLVVDVVAPVPVDRENGDLVVQQDLLRLAEQLALLLLVDGGLRLVDDGVELLVVEAGVVVAADGVTVEQ